MERCLFPKSRQRTYISDQKHLQSIVRLAEHAERYFAPEATQEILDTVLPRFTTHSVHDMMQAQGYLVLLLPTNPIGPLTAKDYLPTVFSLWSMATRSRTYECQFISLLGRIAVSQMNAPPEYWDSNDIGVFTHDQIKTVFSSTLRLMNLPVGSKSNDGTSTSTSTTGYGSAGLKIDMKALHASVLQNNNSRYLCLAKFIVYTMVPRKDGEQDPGFSLSLLGELIQAVELYFHPSNNGMWSFLLTTLVRYVTYAFIKRWRHEQEPDCDTPPERRLTPLMRRKFVEILKPVALLSMFGKDPLTIAAAEVTIRFLAWLEPELVFPSLLERIYPSLETLTETHRTTSALSIVAAVSLPLLSRDHYPSGGKHLVPLLHLAIPGIDLNDPVKTITALMFITNAIMTVPIFDLTMVPNDDAEMMDVDPMDMMVDDTDPFKVLPRPLEDQFTKMSSGQFEEWVAKFLRRIFTILENMPQEDGKKQSETMEANLTQIMLHTCEIVFSQLSEDLYDLALRLIADFATEQVLPNAVRALGSLCDSIASIHPKKAAKKFIPICCERIKNELEHGAASTMTNADTASLIQSDATLHWYQHILFSVVASIGSEWLVYQSDLLDIGQAMVSQCRSRRGMMWGGKFLRHSLKTLLCTYPLDYRSLPPQEWADAKLMDKSHQLWGRPADPKHIDVQWHTPSPAEKDMALTLLDTFLIPAMDRLQELMTGSHVQMDSHAVTNDFCRQLAIVRNCLIGTTTMVADDGEDIAPLKPQGDGNIEETNPLQSDVIIAGYAFTDPADPKTQLAREYRARLGKLLHDLVQYFSKERDNDVESIKILVKALRLYLSERGVDKTWFERVKHGYNYSKNLFKSPGDKKRYPRSLLVLRAYIAHLQRLKHNSMRRVRTPIHDALLKDLLLLSTSSYSEIRKVSQSALGSSARCYLGSKDVLLPEILALLKHQPELDPLTAKQQMKGALYLLKHRSIQLWCLRDWKYIPAFILSLCQAHHSDDLSIQELVRKLFLEYITQFYQCSFKLVYQQEPLTNPLHLKLHQKVQDRLTNHRSIHHQLTLDLVALLQSGDKLHWRFATMAANFLELLIRVELAPTRDLANTFVRTCLLSELPAMRRIGISGVMQLLLFIKQRTFANGNEDLLIMRSTRHPLKKAKPLNAVFTNASNPTQAFLSLATSPTSTSSFLIDDPTVGWYAWPKEVVGYVTLEEAGQLPEIEHDSRDAYDALVALFKSADTWKSMMDYMAQEANQKQDDRFNSSHVRLYASVFQMMYQHPEVIACAREQLERLCSMTDQKHMQRAASELMAGLVRGTKHWPLAMTTSLWQDWLGALVTSTLTNVTPDTHTYWSTFLRCCCSRRDPRRLVPLVQAVLATGFDPTSDAAFTEASKLTYVHSIIMGMKWRFQPWSGDLLALYIQNLNHPYKQVREVLGRNMNDMMQIQWIPGFASVSDALNASLSHPGGNQTPSLPTLEIDLLLRPILETLDIECQHDIQLDQQPLQGRAKTHHYASCKTVLCWLREALSTWHVTGTLKLIPAFLPVVFRMLQFSEDQDLQQSTSKVLSKMAQMNFPPDMVSGMVDQLLHILTTSPNWHVRVRTLPLLQVFFFKHLFLLDGQVIAIMDAIGSLLLDHRLEVRHMASITLGGLVRCSQRDAIDSLRQRYTALLVHTKLPKRHRNEKGKLIEPEGFHDALLRKHAGALGLACLVNAFPYEVPSWMPSVLCTLANCMSGPAEIQATIRTTFSDFRRTHSDTWHEDINKFTEDQLSLLSDMLISPSYYA
ncbi:hypothetical protein DM01DRAFT_330261 [Hesseltinella vesiculosa]|uniref:ARM repeat-containing protein n=1 Tax=Hesseltinella vesiculosa TaxID=101127 RepID=A0A1X2GKQ6_9FUNG|nr:hypothetical protein DM01DRAFT_330261 [Hesseltinella vesiculosa]